ncbi:LacI family DNA-binding transcriptional regulator [Clostridium guangxiense]|uniref:LacI family DNA-binding transcriptional regulator n=2 Tax=Clostridium TaxID=1485 RepID=UPI001E306548|nr:LacI family transcriptional regulator [Clostridium guangxiense]
MENENVKRPTIKDVAKIAGVSVATVSRIINGLDGYSEETRLNVMKTVNELGYRRNAVAAHLKIKETHAIGVLMPRIDTGFYTEILNGIEDAAHKNNYSVIICNTGNSGIRTMEYLNVLCERQVDGIIVCSMSPTEDFDKEILETRIPSILVSTLSYRCALPYVRVDDYQASYAAASYLIKNGHKKVAMLSGPLSDPIAGIQRINGYKQALIDNQLDINENIIKYSKFNFEAGKLAMRELLEEHDKFTAIFAACDTLAVAALSVAYENGISIPDDISVIGYDNTKEASMCIPPLTTLAQPLSEMGKKAFNMIIKKISTKSEVESIIMPYKIIERSTVKNI